MIKKIIIYSSIMLLSTILHAKVGNFQSSSSVFSFNSSPSSTSTSEESQDVEEVEDVTSQYPEASDEDLDQHYNMTSDKELYRFYNNEDFPTGLYNRIHAAIMTAEADVANTQPGITTSELKKIFPDPCDKVIDQVATIVRNSVTVELLEGSHDIKIACPKWQNLSDDDRKDFYVALVTSMALAESSCNNRNNGDAVNGTGFGLFQGTKFRTPAQGAKWVMQVIHRQVSQSGLLFWPDSKHNYWAVLNPELHAGKVKKMLNQIPACVIREIKRKETNTTNPPRESTQSTVPTKTIESKKMIKSDNSKKNKR
jgi:hypothetical protein